MGPSISRPRTKDLSGSDLVQEMFPGKPGKEQGKQDRWAKMQSEEETSSEVPASG